MQEADEELELNWGPKIILEIATKTVLHLAC